MSARTRTLPKLIALALPALALFYFPSCAPVAPGTGPGTGGGTVGTGGGTPGVGGAAAGGGFSTGGGAATTGGAGNTGGGAPTGGASTGGSGTGGGPVGTGGNSGGTFVCNPPVLPESSGLTEVNMKLPDPFTFYDGTKVTTKEMWDCRRKEILAMAAKYLYAPVPPPPDNTTGTVSGGTVNITATVGAKSESFTATIGGSGSYIALELGLVSLPGSHKTLSFGSGFKGKIESLFGISGVNDNIANGWMIDRMMDVLEANPDSGHDPKKIAVTGCSGCGKGAYLAGVFSRVPLTVIVESGGGGVANLRQVEWFGKGEGNSTWQCADAVPQSIDNLENSGACTPWMTAAASWVRSDASKVYNLPFDTHMILATIAPRYLVHYTNNNGTNSWCHLGGTCEALSAWAAKPVWKALGVPERMGFSMYSAQHCQANATQTALTAEMMKLAFDGDTSANTDVMDIPDSGVQQPVSEWEAMWIDWDMETVLQ
jgi:hypothetical protein